MSREKKNAERGPFDIGIVSLLERIIIAGMLVACAIAILLGKFVRGIRRVFRRFT